MRRLVVPFVTLSCLCCATLPRATRTDVLVSGGIARTNWTENTGACASFPPARQLDDQVQVGVAVVHENANGLELGGAVEGMRETVTASRDHPTPPDGARDYLLGGGVYVGGKWRHFGFAAGGSGWASSGTPYFSMDFGRMEHVWAHVQIGRWRPFMDARYATLGGAFRPFEGGLLEIWAGATRPALWVYPVANRVPAGGQLGDAQLAAGLNMQAQVNDMFAIFLQVAGSQSPSGHIGISFSPSRLLEPARPRQLPDEADELPQDVTSTR